MRRVVIVARSVYPLHRVGGLERSVFDLANYLTTHNVDVTLITQPSTTGHAGHFPAARTIFIRYITFPFAGRRGTTVIDRSTAYPFFGLRAGRAAFALAQKGKVDVVHGFGASVLGYARRRALTRVPLVMNPQGMEEFGATDPSQARLKRAAYLPLRLAVRTCAQAADCVIATDRALEPSLRTHLEIPARKVTVIPNGLDLAWVDRLATPDDAARVRRGAGIKPAETVLLSVGRIEHNKGFHVLAQALAAVRTHSGALAHGNWRWVIAGEGPYRSQLEQVLQDVHLRDYVHFAGRVHDRDLHAWYDAATLFVHPSLYEGSSLVTLEAMAHRRAVVATMAGGLPDKVRPNINGWLVPPGDASALAAAVSGALANPARLAHLGSAGRAIVEQEFSWHTIGAATLRLYDQLV